MVPHQNGQVLRVGVLSAIHNIDPRTAHDTESMFVVRQIFESPFEVNAGTSAIEPQLAAGPLQPVAAGDRPGYRLRLRDDVRFSDGTPLDVVDAIVSLRQAGILIEQADIERDGETIVLRPKQANVRLDLSLTHGLCCIARRAAGSLLGTGPYRLAPGSTADWVRLEKNPHYRDGAGVDEIHFRAYPLDGDGRATPLARAVSEGEVDLTTVLPRDEIDALSGVRKSITPGISTAILFLNHESPRLRDARHRQAIARAIDRLEVAKRCYTNALAFTATSLLPRPLGAVDDLLTYDLPEAERLLAAAGGPPEPLRMLTTWGPRTYLPRPVVVAETVRDQLADVGIAAEIETPATVGEFLDAVCRGEHDLVVGGWVADTLDPCDFLESILASNRVPSAENITVSANHGRLRWAEMDDALAGLRRDRTTDSFQRVMELVARDPTVVPLMYGAAATVSSFRLRDVPPTPLAHFPLAQIAVDG